jgi:hypothetical protein
MTLDEQIAGLEGFTTANADQFRTKNTVLSTLRKLKAIRSQFEFQRPNEGKVVSLLLDVLGEHPPKRQAE